MLGAWIHNVVGGFGFFDSSDIENYLTKLVIRVTCIYACVCI